ncbi:CLUMA_CG009367, isoform A [Clunio marinus]|uniref:CLUMA_CG009367, isoform A n=1 Tax=Clunio marinus TaxID=568069 RepID=A0A1J1IBV7_9DIPT|nr:CLUMA_CG009367, isoform A [Clunio marinus]
MARKTITRGERTETCSGTGTFFLCSGLFHVCDEVQVSTPWNVIIMFKFHFQKYIKRNQVSQMEELKRTSSLKLH